MISYWRLARSSVSNATAETAFETSRFVVCFFRLTPDVNAAVVDFLDKPETTFAYYSLIKSVLSSIFINLKGFGVLDWYYLYFF